MQIKFEHEDPDDLIRNRLDHYPNTRANHIFAEAIYDFPNRTNLLLRASDLSANLGWEPALGKAASRIGTTSARTQCSLFMTPITRGREGPEASRH